MAGAYTVSVVNATVATIAGLIIIRTFSGTTARGSQLRIVHMSVSQDEDTNAIASVMWGRAGAAGDHALAPTPRPVNIDTVASAITGDISVANGTVASVAVGGQSLATVMGEVGFIGRAGWEWLPTPDEYIYLIGNQYFALTMGTVTSTTNWNASLTYEEVV